jgi:hypothetical protein
MEEWFLNEFGPYGFRLSVTMYSPETFAPMKKVIHPSGIYTRVNLTPELADDLRGWGMTYESRVEEYREMFKETLYNLYPEIFKPKDFRPIEKIPKLSFT